MHKTALFALAVFSTIISAQSSQFSYSIVGNCTDSPVVVTIRDAITNQPLRAQVRFQLVEWNGLLQEVYFNWSDPTDGTARFVPAVPGRYYVSISRPGYAPVDFNWDIEYCPECRVDADCNGSSKCINHSCVQITGTCGYAANHTWIYYECCEDSHCATNQVCVANRCVNLTGRCGRAQNHTWYNYACCVDADCPQGQVCTDHVCAEMAECTKDADCMDNEICANNKCVVLTGECGIASNHRWIRYECCSDDECASGRCLDNHTCAPEPLETTSQPPAQPCPLGFLLATAVLLVFACKR